VIVGDQEHLDKMLELVTEGCAIDRIIVFDPKGASAHRGNLVLSFKDVQQLGRRFETDHPQWFMQSVARVAPDDVYDIMFTSGTSGLPKGAMCDQRGPVMGAEISQTSEDSAQRQLAVLSAAFACFRTHHVYRGSSQGRQHCVFCREHGLGSGQCGRNTA
jgi:long-chain acyl-CoA synthetase